MSRNGSGVYSLPSGNPVVTNTTISSTWANSTLSDISSALTGSIAADGQTPITGTLQMSNNLISNLLDPANSQDAATKNYVDTVASGLGSTYLTKANNLSDVANASTSRTNLGLGSISTQAASAVAITGGTIAGVTISSLAVALPVASGGTGVTTSTGTGANVLGTSPTIATPTITGNITDGTYTTSVASTAQGTAKAWVNFSGVSTITINASYNVSSVTRNSTGDYTINFTNAMVDANYAMVGTTVCYQTGNTACTAIALKGNIGSSVSLKSTTQVEVVSILAGTSSPLDTINASVSIFR